MAKKIYSNFSGGLSDSDRNAPENQYYAGRDVDLYRNWGYLTPGVTISDIANIGLTGDVNDIILYDNPNPAGHDNAYLFDTAGRIHCVYTELNLDSSSDTYFGGGSENYVTVTGMTESKGLIAYSATDSAYRAYFFYNGTANDIGKGVPTSNDWSGANLDVDWGSTVPTGGATLNAGRRDVIEWSSYIWYTNGQYVGKLDVSVDAAVMVPQSFDLGAGWTADRVFVTNDNYLGIVASKTSSNFAPVTNKSPNDCRIYIIDLGMNLLQLIPITGMAQVHAIVNKDGMILFWGDNGAGENIMGTLQDNGINKLATLQHDVAGTLTTIRSPRSQSAITTYKNNILFGTENLGLIMSYGRRNVNDNFALSCPMSRSVVANSRVTVIKQLDSSRFYIGYFDGTNYKLCRTTGLTYYSTNASWKAPYMDFGQRVRINYVKVYFKPLVTSDSLTLGMDTDYGTSNTLGIGTGNISYTKDGAVTSKKFIKQITCHAFRPTITWAAGGTQISKIVVDYTFISD